MSLRTEEVCRENEARTESTRHSPGGYIVTQDVGITGSSKRCFQWFGKLPNAL